MVFCCLVRKSVIPAPMTCLTSADVIGVYGDLEMYGASDNLQLVMVMEGERNEITAQNEVY